VFLAALRIAHPKKCVRAVVICVFIPEVESAVFVYEHI
jgi:hypothetical protein